MKIQVKNLGVIASADISLDKKLTIFCGPNGTGKTYLAYVIYALTNEIKLPMIMATIKSIQLEKLAFGSPLTYEIDVKDLFDFYSHVIKEVKENLAGLFAVSESKANQFFKETQLAFDDTEESMGEKINHLVLDDVISDFGYQIKIKKSKGSMHLLLSMEKNDSEFAQYKTTGDIVKSLIYKYLWVYPIARSVIFPVERNAIYTFSKELSIKRNELVDRLQSLSDPSQLMNLIHKRATRYPLPIRDILRDAEDLENLQKAKSTYFEFAEEIENHILGGKVQINKEGSVEFLSGKAKNISLSFHQSSSIVKTLASLILYLKHKAVKNDLLIIDEPELNLHPHNQVLLSRIFAQLINNGLRLLISTHSDYIIRELNNLVMISNRSEEMQAKAKEYGYQKNEYIDQEDISVYKFDFVNKERTTVSPIKIDAEGFSVEVMDDVIDKMNERSGELSYILKMNSIC